MKNNEKNTIDQTIAELEQKIAEYEENIKNMTDWLLFASPEDQTTIRILIEKEKVDKEMLRDLIIKLRNEKEESNQPGL